MKTYFTTLTTNSVSRVVFYANTFDSLPFNSPRGSYNVLKARLFNLHYANFLRLARDTFNATLKGQTGYITEVFLDEKDAKKMAKELNTRLNKILALNN